MKASIITVVRNNAKYIEDCIESVLNQSYQDIEYIVIDGNSDDGTVGIIEKYSDQISSWVSERDDGIYDAMNKGIEMSGGDIVGFLHSDDIYRDDSVIDRVVKSFSDNDVDCVYGDLEYVTGAQKRVVRYWKAGEYDPRSILRGWMPPHPTMFVKRELFSRLGLYDTSFRIAADYEYILRLFKSGEIRASYVPSVFVQMRLGGASNRSVGNLFRKMREDYRAMRMHGLRFCLLVLFCKNFSKVGQFASYFKTYA